MLFPGSNALQIHTQQLFTKCKAVIFMSKIIHYLCSLFLFFPCPKTYLLSELLKQMHYYNIHLYNISYEKNSTSSCERSLEGNGFCVWWYSGYRHFSSQSINQRNSNPNTYKAHILLFPICSTEWSPGSPLMDNNKTVNSSAT